jgi:hypothetical protein
MADAPKKKSGSGIAKRLGPLPYWGWALAAVGGYIGYRYLQARNSAAAASGTTGGTLIPNDIGLPASTTATGAGSFSSISQWTQAMLTYLTGNGVSPADALNGVTSWLNGNCVSQTIYNQLSAGIVSSSVGLPPGYTNVPTLSVCPSPTQTPTTTNPAPATPSAPVAAAPLFQGLDAALQKQLSNNGETVAATAWDSTLNEFVVLTNKGGIYNVNPQGAPSGGAFYGSYLGLPAADRATVPGQVRTFTQLIINPDGTYTALDSAGESYTFTPSTPQAA